MATLHFKCILSLFINCNMTTETHSNNEGPSGANDGDKCNTNPNDLTGSKQKITQQKSDIAHSSPTKSPTKFTGGGGSPTKSSKNKRRNEARRRNANQRKQQPTQGSHKEDLSDLREESKSPTISPSPSPTPPKLISDSNESGSVQDANNYQLKSDDIDKQSSNKQTNSSQRSRQATERDKSREHKEMREQLKAQNTMVQSLIEKLKAQTNKTRELEAALLSTTRTCNQLKQLLQQEFASRSKLETENTNLDQTISRLKSQIGAHEKNKSQNDELVRVLNATLMERETEVSILKLKLTRLQTNPSSNIALNSNTSINSIRPDPCHSFATTGRSHSEFNRNSYIRSSMMAEAASARSSTTHLKSDRDASVWATVPEELTPSKRPLLLEKSLQPIYNEPLYSHYDLIRSQNNEQPSPLTRDRRYRTLPRSMKSPPQESETYTRAQKTDQPTEAVSGEQPSQCQVTNLDDSNSTNQSGSNKTSSFIESKQQSPSEATATCHQIINEPAYASHKSIEAIPDSSTTLKTRVDSVKEVDSSHYSTITKTPVSSRGNVSHKSETNQGNPQPSPPGRAPTTPIKISSGLKRILGKFRRSGSSQSKTDLTDIMATPTKSPFKRGAHRSTLVGTPSDIRANISPMRQAMNFQTDKPFADWNTDMLADWLTMIGLSMYTQQCRRWVKRGSDIMIATPAEVDKGLGITNHLHRKKLRLAISELNGDCDKITKAASKLDYLWVARWLDDIGLPQHKEAFINARIDGRVLNYLTVDDLLSLGVKSVLHHASIKCGIRVLRSIEFDLQQLKRRATAGEVDQMNSTRQRLNQVADDLISTPLKRVGAADLVNQLDVPLWTCHKVMEWLRMIDFAEFAPNLRGSGVHGGLIVFEDGFNIDTMCALLSIPSGRTLLRRHLSTFFKELIGEDLAQKKRQHQNDATKLQLNPTSEIKSARKSQWLTKLRGSKVTQDNMDDYLCPMYPVEPQIIKTTHSKNMVKQSASHLPEISESINV